jgi:hypothetical protein
LKSLLAGSAQAPPAICVTGMTLIVCRFDGNCHLSVTVLNDSCNIGAEHGFQGAGFGAVLSGDLLHPD